MARYIIPKKEVLRRTGLSNTTIWRLERAGEFPSRVQMTAGGRVGWYEAEVDAWIAERVRGFSRRVPPRARGAA